MTKTLRNTLLSFLCIFLLGFCINVNAAGNVAKIGDTEYASVQAAIDAATDGQTVVLLDDITEGLTVDGKNMTLDLGGKTLTVTGWGIDVYDSNFTVTNGTLNASEKVGVYLNSGNTFTLDSSAKIVGDGNGITSDLYPETATVHNTSIIKGEINVAGTGIWVDNPSTVTVNSGAKVIGNNGIVLGSESGASNLTVNGYVQGSNVGITINGMITSTTEHPTITVGGSAEIVAVGDETVALYLAGYGETTIADGAKVTGDASAIEIRAGELTINGGTFTSTYEGEIKVNSNGNGSTTTGAALAIAQHTTAAPISVTVNGGTFNGVAAVYESNPENNADVSNDVEMTITDGTFNATGDKAVYSADEEEFISGGTFNTDIESDYVVQNKIEYRVDDNTTLIGEPVTGLVIKQLNKNNVTADDITLINGALPEGFVIGGYYSVNYGSHRPAPDNSMITAIEETQEELEVVLNISKLPKAAAGATRTFKVVRVHDGEAEVLDASAKGNNKVSTMSNKFSTYAVVYKDTQSQNRETSVTSKGNPATGDSLLLIVLFMMIGLVGSYITSKKLANR